MLAGSALPLGDNNGCKVRGCLFGVCALALDPLPMAWLSG